MVVTDRAAAERKVTRRKERKVAATTRSPVVVEVAESSKVTATTAESPDTKRLIVATRIRKSVSSVEKKDTLLGIVH